MLVIFPFNTQSGKLEFVRSLMDFDPKLLVKDKLGNTPLHYAAEKYPEVLNTLLKKAQELGMENAQCSQTVMTELSCMSAN